MTIPTDFSTQWKIKTREELAEHYRCDVVTITRWCRHLGLKRGSDKVRRQLRAMPVDFAKNGHLPQDVLIQRYSCGKDVIRRWRNEAGIVIQRRSVHRPAVTTGNPTLAAVYLQRYGPVSRCTSEGVMGGGSHWRRGSRILSDEQLVEKAVSLGWDAGQWSRITTPPASPTT